MRLNALVGSIGWLAPAVIAVPFATMRESAGGESALLAVIVWWALATIGCGIAGAILGSGPTARAARMDVFLGGLTGVSLAWIASFVLGMAIHAIVGVLDLGPVAQLIPVPFVLAYGLGFGITTLATR